MPCFFEIRRVFRANFFLDAFGGFSKEEFGVGFDFWRGWRGLSLSEFGLLDKFLKVSMEFPWRFEEGLVREGSIHHFGNEFNLQNTLKTNQGLEVVATFLDSLLAWQESPFSSFFFFLLPFLSQAPNFSNLLIKLSNSSFRKAVTRL